jgi:hypothetical protein
MGTFARSTLAVLALATVVGCEEPAASSDTIVIRLSGIKEDDIRDGTVEEEKNVTTEVSNPYAQFLADSRAALGADPSRIEVETVAITLGGDSRGVLGFQELFTGTVDVFLRTDDGGTVYVGRVENPAGVGPVECEVAAGETELAPILPSLLAGSFRVGVRGATPRVATDDFDAKVEIAIRFASFE